MEKIIFLNHHERVAPRVSLEMKTLGETGFDVVIINWDRTGGKTNLYSLYDGKPVKWVHVKAPKASWTLIFTLLKYYMATYRCLKREEFNAIHCTHLFLLPIAIFSAWSLKAKVVYDSYERHALDISYAYVKGSILRKLVRAAIEIIENFLVKSSDGVLVVSSKDEFLKKRFFKYNKNIEVLFNVPMSVESKDDYDINALSRKYLSKELIIYAGNLYADKGVAEMLGMMKLIKDIHPTAKLLLIGGDTPAQLKTTQTLVDSEDLSEYVEVIPYQPYNEMVKYLLLGKVGLFVFSHRERAAYSGRGTHRKLFTYMSCGLPLVVVGGDEVGAVVREETCGLVLESAAPERMSRAVLELINNHKLRTEMSNNGKNAIRLKYNWGIERPKLLEVYRRIFKKGLSIDQNV